MAFLFPCLSFYLLSLPSFNLSFTSAKLSFLLGLVPPVRLNLFLWLHTRHSMQLLNRDIRPNGNWCFSPEGSSCSPCKRPPVKIFLGQVPAERGSLTRDHTQSTKAYSHLFIIVSVFQRKKTSMASSAIFVWWLTCLFGLYFSVSVTLAFPTASAVALDDVWYMAVLYPTHFPGINEVILWLLP